MCVLQVWQAAAPCCCSAAGRVFAALRLCYVSAHLHVDCIRRHELPVQGQVEIEKAGVEIGTPLCITTTIGNLGRGLRCHKAGRVRATVKMRLSAIVRSCETAVGAHVLCACVPVIRQVCVHVLAYPACCLCYRYIDQCFESHVSCTSSHVVRLKIGLAAAASSRGHMLCLTGSAACRTAMRHPHTLACF
jgi:hypothetical protein